MLWNLNKRVKKLEQKQLCADGIHEYRFENGVYPRVSCKNCYKSHPSIVSRRDAGREWEIEREGYEFRIEVYRSEIEKLKNERRSDGNH
jgi:hypothetical protein